MTAILLGLGAALTWGAADFSGGVAAKRTNSFGVVIGSHIISVTSFVILAVLLKEVIPPPRDWGYGMAGGLAGGFGLMLLYRALAEGKMSIAAPVSAVVTTLIPIIVGGFTLGIPGPLTLLGFVLAAAAIWLVSSEERLTQIRFDQLGLPLLAGVTFGLFLILVHQATSSAVLWPVVATRIGSLTGLILYSRLTHQNWVPPRNLWPLLAFIGVIDAVGTACYALSARLGRVDIAAVVSSLYPGATVLLAWVFLREKISRIQLVGILLALGAIILLTL